MFASLSLIAAAAGLVSYADARLATQGSSNVAVYWGEVSLAHRACSPLMVLIGQSSGGMAQQNLSTYCAGEPSLLAVIDQHTVLTRLDRYQYRHNPDGFCLPDHDWAWWRASNRLFHTVQGLPTLQRHRSH
jgi:hypothetical protein